MSKTRRAVKVKQENEIQSYINSFKEIEETEEEPSTSGTGKKIQELGTDDFEQIIERDDAGGEDDFKYVFIVQDEEDGEKAAEPEEVYEFDEYEEDALDEPDDKTKIVKILSKTTTKKAGGQAAPQGNSVHMCSYCNYVTPKRYLLARHMKCHSEDR